MTLKLALTALVLSAGFAMAQDAPAGRSVWDGVFTADQAARGQALYAGRCVDCHGAALAGGDTAPNLAGGDFISRWNVQTLGDLFDRIHTTMPPDDPGSVGSANTADIEAYILSQNQFPAGAGELPSDQQAQALIKILAQKPGS